MMVMKIIMIEVVEPMAVESLSDSGSIVESFNYIIAIIAIIITTFALRANRAHLESLCCLQCIYQEKKKYLHT